MSSAGLRARQILRAAGVGTDVPLTRADSAGNEVWLAGPVVARIAHRPGVGRIHHDARVRALLPPTVPVPASLAVGREVFGEWELQQRVSGVTLARAWPAMDTTVRRRLVVELAGILRQIHAVDASELVAPFDDPGALEAPHLLPLDRLRRALAWLRSMGCVDPGLLAAVDEVVERDGQLVAETPTGLVHGDFHLENVLVSGDRITAVVDFEYAHRGWPAQDLEVLARFCAAPDMSVAPDFARLLRADDFRPVITWLHEGYPELFDDPDLVRRVNLCSLAYDVRDLISDPPRRDPRDLSPFHPVNRLMRLVDGRGLLQLIEW